MVPISTNDEVHSILNQPDILALTQDLERHWQLPPGCILCRGFTYLTVADQARIVWTARGGVAVCPNARQARPLVALIEAGAGDDIALQTALEELVTPTNPHGACLDVLLYNPGSPEDYPCPVGHQVEIFGPGDPAVVALDRTPPGAERIFAVRREGTIVARATTKPCLEADGHRLHAVGVWTDPAYRKQGMGKATVIALLKHLRREGDAALWNYQAVNVASGNLARSVGFVEVFRVFTW